MPAFLRTSLNFLNHLIETDRIRTSTLRSIPYWFAAALTAIAAVAYAEFFILIEELTLRIYHTEPLLFFALAPIGFVIGWWLVRKYAPAAAGSGIPQLKVAVDHALKTPQKSDYLLSFRAMGIKVLSSGMTLLGGGAIGREGPTLQISGAIFYQVGKRVPANWPRPNLQSLTLAGGAAGLAAAFNTPLGGIVYVIEELARAHLNSFRTAILHAVVVAGLVAQLVLGPYLYLGYPVLGQWTIYQLPSAVAIGLIVGFAGACYARALMLVFKWRDSITSAIKLFIISILCGLSFATLLYFSGSFTLGSGKELINHVLFKDSHAGSPLLIAGRMLGNFLTAAAGGAGGIFAPALSSGAAIASYLASFFSGTNANLIIVMGMIAFLTGVTHSPFTSFVLVLEMSDRHSAIFPMMIAAISAYAVAVSMNRDSFYDVMALRFEKMVARYGRPVAE